MVGPFRLGKQWALTGGYGLPPFPADQRPILFPPLRSLSAEGPGKAVVAPVPPTRLAHGTKAAKIPILLPSDQEGSGKERGDSGGPGVRDKCAACSDPFLSRSSEGHGRT